MTVTVRLHEQYHRLACYSLLHIDSNKIEFDIIFYLFDTQLS